MKADKIIYGKNMHALVFPLVLLIFLSLCFFVFVPQLAVGCGDNIVWERDFGACGRFPFPNIIGLAVADNEVFVTTYAADLYCLNLQNGKTLWKYNFGAYSEGGFLTIPVVADGKVFVGFRGSRLAAFDAKRGTLLWKFDPNVTSSIASKTPPEFMFADGRVFTTGDGFYCVNATDGKLMWENTGPNRFGGPWVVANGRVLIGSIGDPPTYHWYLNSLSADNGTVLWTYKIFTFVESPPIVADGRVLVWNRRQNQTMLCLDETFGYLLWQYPLEAQAFQPTIANGLVLFGAADGNFYALNESDGSLVWKYPTGFHADAGYLRFAVPKVAFGYVFVEYELVSESYNKHEGYVCALNLANGQTRWIIPISINASSGSSLTIENRTLYVTSFKNLYSINVDDGQIRWMKSFTYWVLEPIAYGEFLLVAADLKVIAICEVEQVKKEALWNPLITVMIVAAVLSIVILSCWFRKKHLKTLI